MFTALGVPMICTPIVTSLHTTCVCWLLNCCVVWWIKCSCRQKRYLLRLHKFLASGNMFLSIGCKWYTHIILTRGNTSPSDRFSWYRQDSLCIGLCALPRSCYQCQSHPDLNADQIVRLLLKVFTVDEIIYIKTFLWINFIDSDEIPSFMFPFQVVFNTPTTMSHV